MAAACHLAGMGETLLTRPALLELRKALARGDAAAAERLARAAHRLPRSAAAVRELHDALLFALAYPVSEAVHAAAQAGLLQVEAKLPAQLAVGGHLRAALQDSGLPGCDTIGLYSLTHARWLLRHWPQAVALHSLDAPAEEAAELLRPLLTQAEREALDLFDGDATAMAAALFGGEPLKGLIAAIDAGIAHDHLRESLFARLQPYLRISGACFPALAGLRGPAHPPFIHAGGLGKGADLRAIVDEPIDAPLPLPGEQRASLIANARAILCLMQRETDPVTYAQEVQAFAMGRGLVIALFHMDAAHRLALESYAGFMAFKNGVPLGYGGAWLFPGRSKVGINVFPALRGGESAWFFAQLLRLYRQRFGVGIFEAENYQLGHGNPDGLKSGAYWFYHRLGFRPWSDRLGRVAAREQERMMKRKGYQPPLRVLKELVADGLVLRLSDEGAPMIDTSALVLAAQRSLAHADDGRSSALRGMARRAARAFGLTTNDLRKPGVRAALQGWLAPLLLAGHFEQWPAMERAAAGAALRARGEAGEDAYQRALRKCGALLEAWGAAQAS